MEDLPGFNVKNETHQKILIENFFKLRESGTLVDCLLEVEGRYLKAHKVILSACSLYFSDLFSQNQGAMFKLADVSFHELEIGIEFIYKGEIVIPQNQLPEFLKVAETLKINGLFENKSSDLENNSSVSQHSSSRKGSQSPKLKKRKIDEVIISKSDSISAQSDSKSLNIAENNKEFTKPKKVFYKNLPNRENTECSASKKTKIGKMKNVDSINVTQEEKVLQKLEVTRAADDTSHKSESLIQQNFESSKIPCKETKRKKIVISHRKPLSNLAAKKYRGLKMRKLPCPKCKRAYKGKTNLDRHLKYQCGKEAKFQCDICHLKTVQKYQLAAHIMRKHNSLQRKTYSCPQCKKTFKLKIALNRHLQCECGKEEAHFQCDICPKRTKKKVHLALHMRKHNPQQGETYSCPRCGKTYTTRGHVTNHVKYGCGKEPQFQCKFCLKKMKLKCLLAIHMIREHNLLQRKTYSCPRCKKTDISQNTLNRHLMYGCVKYL